MTSAHHLYYYPKRSMLVSSNFSLMEYRNIFAELVYDSREVILDSILNRYSGSELSNHICLTSKVDRRGGSTTT